MEVALEFIVRQSLGERCRTLHEFQLWSSHARQFFCSLVLLRQRTFSKSSSDHRSDRRRVGPTQSGTSAESRTFTTQWQQSSLPEWSGDPHVSAMAGFLARNRRATPNR